jgi:hypothetical protein
MSEEFTKLHLEAYMQKLYDDEDPIWREMEMLAQEPCRLSAHHGFMTTLYPVRDGLSVAPRL